MASNNKTYEKKIGRMKNFITRNPDIIEAITKGGNLEIKINNQGIEFYRKEKDRERELISRLEKIGDNIKFLRGCSNIILDLMEKHWDSNPYYQVSLKINYPYKRTQKKRIYKN